LNAELNPICHLLALLGAHHIFHSSRIRVNGVVSVALSDYHPKEKTVLKDVTTELNAVLFDVYSGCCVKF